MRFLFISMFICFAGCKTVQKTDFISLFDGKTTTGWTSQDNFPGGKWEVADNMIIASADNNKNGGSFCTKNIYKDYILNFELMIDWPCEASVLLRGGPGGKGHEITFNYRPGGEIGTINCPYTQGIVARAPDDYTCGDTPDTIPSFYQDDWNMIRIRIKGEPALIQLWINDKLVTDFLHSEKTTKGIPKEGRVCLQIKGGFEGAAEKKARFRNIQLKKL